MRRKNVEIEILILKQILNEKLTPDESSQLTAWCKKMKYHKDLPERFNDLYWVAKKLDKFERYPAKRVWEKVLAGINTG